MRMLRKLFLPVILFGTLLVSTSIGFVSCSDDYDDTKLTSSITDLTGTTTDLQTKLTALETAQALLPTMAQLNAIATQSAQNTADIATNAGTATSEAAAAQATAIDSAYIADAAQLIVINQTIDDVETALKVSIAATQASSDTKLDADQVADAISAAITTNNSGYVTTAIADAVAGLQNADDVKALITAAIADNDLVNSTDIADAIAADNLIDATNVATAIADAITSYDLVDGTKLNSAITTALANYDLGIQTILTGITDNVTTLQGDVATINTNITTINSQLSALGFTVKTMMTQLAAANKDVIWYYGDPVATDVTFGPANEISYTSGEEINNLSLGILAHVNPADVDMSLYSFSIINSEKTELPVINLGTPVNYVGLLTKAATSNNLWEFPTTMDWSEVGTPADLYDQMTSGSDLVCFALAAKNIESGRQLTSSYELTFKRTLVAPSTGLTLKRSPTTSELNADITFTVKDGPTPIIGSANPVYKKYITLADSSDDAALFTGLNTLLNNDDIITVQGIDASLINKDIDFRVHYLNYDGTVDSTNTANVLFTKIAYTDVTINMNSTIDFTKLITSQTSEMTAVTPFGNEVGAFADYITDNNIQTIDIDGNTIDGAMAMPSAAGDEATLNFLKSDGTVLYTATIGTPMDAMDAAAAFTNDLDKITLNFSANTGFVDAVGTYGIKLVFKNNVGNIVNNLYLKLNVVAPSDKTMKTTTAWNTELTEANVWAEITGANAEYNMTNSYLVDPSSFEYNQPDPADNAMSFAGSTFSIPGYGTIADRTGNNYSVTSTYNTFAGGTVSTDWVVTNAFDVHMRSAVNEATPDFATPAAADASLIYKNTADNSKEVLDITSILATDPSDISQDIEYAPTILDSRIASITYTIIDPDETGASSNAGLAKFVSLGGVYSSSMTVTGATLDPISIVSAFHANVTGAPAALGDDVTLNLQMEVTDIFGFTNTFKLPFTVKKNQN